MQSSQKFDNPFYGLLLAAGIVFALTAISYGVMAFREARPAMADAPVAAGPHPLIDWMSEHGEKALLAELGFLAVFTFAAIGTDSYWQRRASQKNKKK